ncbi:endonuclease/exonuclease/phosphatase family protein [Streptomyces sp. NPDC048338]|uniref:endonuclease/exonuclease/phosphatase family protein n=1 Tax=Streptomyces sp. NPDC048338 TaxID=3365536 RepID=UPI003716703A
MRTLKSGLAMLGSLVFLLVASATVAPTARAADVVEPGTAPPLRFSTYNICGSACVAADDGGLRVDEVVEETDSTLPGSTSPGWKADVVFVQEICEYQYNSIMGKLAPRGYIGNYAQTKPKGDEKGLCLDRSSYGMAVFVKGVLASNENGWDSANTDLDLNTYQDPVGRTGRLETENIKSPCIKAYVQHRALWACSVHLYWGDEGTTAGTYRDAEAKKLGSTVDNWQAGGVPVLLGGDFNTQPWNPGTDPFYERFPVFDQGSYGSMTEVDETDAQFFQRDASQTTKKCVENNLTRCRSGETTHYGETARKIDYIFATSRFFKNVKGDALPRDARVSDHAKLRGAAGWADCVPASPAELATGAVFRVDASGALFRYAGKTGGGLEGACKVGFGWRDMRSVSRQGSTLVAVDEAGDLWKYPVDPATGWYSAGTRVKVGSGFQDIEDVLTPGDTDGDGHPDLLVRRSEGNLWRHSGTAAGGYDPAGIAVAPPAPDKAWGGYDKLMAAGDFARDGAGDPVRTDLIARDVAGDLWLHKGDATGGYAPQVKIDSGWQTYTALAAPGDLDGDTYPDLVARDHVAGTDYGNLWFYKGDGAGGYATRTRIGNGYPDADVRLF